MKLGCGAPDTIRTCGLHLRRVALYPAELRAHRYSDSVRDRPRSIANSRIDMAQTTRAKASPITAIRTPQPPFGLLPWCFRDLECDFRASFEFRQSLGFTRFLRHPRPSERACICLRRATLYPAELRVRAGGHLADWPGVGNGLGGAVLGVRKAPKAKVTRSNRVGCVRNARAERAGTVAAGFPWWRGARTGSFGTLG